jgi:hypothetical protein
MIPIRWSRHLARAACTLFLVAAPALATDILHTTGWMAPTPPDNFTLHRDGSADVRGGGVGGFTGTWNGEEIVFWCYDLDQFFNFNHNYSDYTRADYAGADADELRRLFAVAFDDSLFTNQHRSAAFQLAVWNIEYDDDNDVTAGAFRAFNGTAGSAAAVTLANDWLNEIRQPGVSGAGWTLTRFTSRTNQDFIMGTQEPSQQVPEPPALALVLLALLAAVAMAMRRVPVGRRR